MKNHVYRLAGAGSALIIVMSLLASPGSATGQTKIGAREVNDAFINAASLANPAVVTIVSDRTIRRTTRRPFSEFWSRDPQPEREYQGTVLGSGVIIDARRGHIITNYHVVEDADDIHVILADHRELVGEIVGTDPATDLAVIKVTAKGLSALKMGDSDDLRVGEWVLAIGSPFSQNLEHTVTAGIVSAKGRNNVLSVRGRRYEDFIQTDAAINPGNSGGALVNLDGELVGINTAIATDGFSRSNVGVGFAIPINLVRRIINDLIAEGKVTRAFLGVTIQDLEPGTAKAFNLDRVIGAIITKVVDDSPADKAGLRESDVILKVDNIDIEGASHLTNVISTSRPGDKRKLTWVRKGKTRSARITLAELPTIELAIDEPRSRRRDSGFGEMGLAVADLDDRESRRFRVEARSGVLVIDVDPRSDAAREGIMPGDVVVRIGDAKVGDLRDYRKALRPYRTGDTVLVRVARGDGFLFFGVEKS